MTHVEALKPDVLVLMGPFVSASHPAIATGDVDELPTDMFKRHIARRLARLTERSPSTLPILVPSTEDVFHAHHAYPQPFLDKTDPSLGLPKRVRCLPNPSVFYVNELAIGVSTADVLSDLRREELVQRVQPSGEARGTPGAKAADLMSRLSRHVLSQRSFYPLFPAAQLPLDLSHSRLCALDQVTPDLLLLPSPRVKSFLRVVDSTMVANPGTLARVDATAPAPAFVRLQVAPMARNALYQGTEADAELVTHELYQRARIELVQATS